MSSQQGLLTEAFAYTQVTVCTAVPVIVACDFARGQEEEYIAAAPFLDDGLTRCIGMDVVFERSEYPAGAR